MEIRFKLNPKNEKDKVIIDVLSGEYSPSETIKNILYKMGMDGIEGHRMLIGEHSDYVNICTEGDANPTDGNDGNGENKTSNDAKWKATDKKIVNDNDIICYFCN